MNFKCKKTKIQEYECEVCSKPFFSKDKFICFDKCLSNELFYLWDLGITTTGCCCGGHNIEEIEPYIGVIDEDIIKMKDLGYEIKFNKNRPDAQDTFYPQGLNTLLWYGETICNKQEVK